MPDICETCKFHLDDRIITCKSCHGAQHLTESCTGLSSTELRALILVKKTLFYFCQACRDAFKSLSMPLREINSFKNELIAQKREINEVRNLLKSLKDENNSLKSELILLKHKNQQVNQVERSKIEEKDLNDRMEQQKSVRNAMVENSQAASDEYDDLKSLLEELDNLKVKSSASTEPKICNQCKEAIKGGVLTALGKTWHPEHFCCNSCKEPIEEDTFHTKEDMPYCTPCFTKLFAKICHDCDQPIMDKCVQAMGVNWHEDHFVCKDCKSKLIGTQFMEIEGVPYCQKCYLAKHASRCKGCSKPIADKAIIALDAKWHQMCFRCSRCEKPIMKDQSFQVDGGKPHCVKC